MYTISFCVLNFYKINYIENMGNFIVRFEYSVQLI